MGETNPTDLSTMLSVAYSDFKRVSREIWMDCPSLPIADSGRGRHGQTNPNKPNEVKVIGINDIGRKREKQTQRAYRSCFQLLTAILRPNFEKFGWIARPSRSPTQRVFS
jgi:hypothetical protein